MVGFTFWLRVFVLGNPDSLLKRGFYDEVSAINI